MYNGKKVIDIHGHHSTPPGFRGAAYNLIALRTPGQARVEMTDEALEGALQRHLKIMDEREIDVQLISPRPVAMMHWEMPFIVEKWTKMTNEVIHKSCQMHADRFVGVAQLPQNSEIPTSNCIDELEHCVKDYGFVSAILNPDPGGDRQTPGMNTEYWYPLYEKAQQLDIPLIVHPSISRDPRITIIPHNYQYNNVTEEYLATELLMHGDVFKTFPKLKIIVCHCGGALNRFITVRGRDESMDLSDNLYFDTCAYEKWFLSAAIQQKGVDQMMFGTEAPGSGGAIRPDTGRPSDDLVPVIDSIEFLSLEEKMKIFRENALRVFTHLEVD